MLLYLVSWVLIVLLEKKKEHKVAFAFSAWYLPLVIVNPLAGMVLDKMQILPERIVRLYWLLPVFPVIAYGLALLVQSAGKKRYVGTLMTAVLVMGLVFVGKPIIADGNYVKAENLYKLPDDVIQIVDLINADAAGQDAGDDRKSVMPLELSTYARQYDGSLLMLYGRYPTQNDREIEAYELMGQQKVPVDRVVELAAAEECRYLVLDTEKEWENMLGEDQLVPVGACGNYCLYRIE